MAQGSLNAHNVKPDSVTLNYHLNQWNEPYRSTVHFCDFIADELAQSRRVVDLGCGAGGPTRYLADRYPEVSFIGLDVSPDLITHALKLEIPNLAFEDDNAESLKVRFGIDGVVMMQTLHTMPDPALPLHQVATRIRPSWVALSTLIYDGNINCQIVVSEPMIERMQYYNVFGLPGLTHGMQVEGYRLAKYREFKIDADLPKPANPDVMGTYTIKTETGRLQCSGPLLLPWGFVLFERTHANAD
jgi:SAM-dependent methyltransferase